LFYCFKAIGRRELPHGLALLMRYRSRSALDSGGKRVAKVAADIAYRYLREYQFIRSFRS
ncbi:MAG: hypothetical protein ACTIKE_06700, partial [Sphingobacterium sp.]